MIIHRHLSYAETQTSVKEQIKLHRLLAYSIYLPYSDGINKSLTALSYLTRSDISPTLWITKMRIKSLTVYCVQASNSDTNAVVFLLSTQQRWHVGPCFPSLIGWKDEGFLKR